MTSHKTCHKEQLSCHAKEAVCFPSDSDISHCASVGTGCCFPLQAQGPLRLGGESGDVSWGVPITLYSLSSGVRAKLSGLSAVLLASRVWGPGTLRNAWTSGGLGGRWWAWQHSATSVPCSNVRGRAFFFMDGYVMLFLHASSGYQIGLFCPVQSGIWLLKSLFCVFFCILETSLH